MQETELLATILVISIIVGGNPRCRHLWCEPL